MRNGVKRPIYRAKNKKKCKINSRNFTYIRERKGVNEIMLGG
jgi:hypothetical protein